MRVTASAASAAPPGRVGVDAVQILSLAVRPDRLAIDCVDLMERVPKMMVLLVADDDRRLVGALHLRDLFRARVV
jgi:CBS domain-containing protein